MSDPLTYMNTLTQWKEPPPWDVQWAHTVGQACQMISERDLQIDNIHKMLIAEQCKVAQLLAACEAALEANVRVWGSHVSETSKSGSVQAKLRAAIAATVTEVQAELAKLRK